jgi:response regulator NasT
MRIVRVGITSDDVRGALAAEDLVVDVDDAGEVWDAVTACDPDVVLAAAEVPALAPALARLAALLPVPVVLVGRADAAWAAFAGANIVGWLTRPVAPAVARALLLAACAGGQRLAAARAEAAQLREAFAARKTIDRAKGLVMQRQGVNEAAAYAWLRDESRRRRLPMVDVARAVVDETPGGRT